MVHSTRRLSASYASPTASPLSLLGLQRPYSERCSASGPGMAMRRLRGEGAWKGVEGGPSNGTCATE